MEKKRADVVLWELGLCESRSKARAVIKEGLAFVDGKPISKPSEQVDAFGTFTLDAEASADVSRAGQKLKTALDAFNIDVSGVFADIGASTGGFTQCLLERGAKKVYAVDVGRGQLHASLKNDARVVNMEGVNARELKSEDFAEAPDGIVMDVSFISQTLIYPALSRILSSGKPLITLVKPQFEVGRENVGKKGIVKDKNGSLLEMVMLKIRLAADDNGFELLKTVPSPIKGKGGNAEYLALFRKK